MLYDHSPRIYTPSYMSISLLLSIEGGVTVVSPLAFECLMPEVIYLLVLFYLTLLVFCKIMAVVLDHIGPGIGSGFVIPQDPLFLC